MTDTEFSIWARIGIAFTSFSKALFEPDFARQVSELAAGRPPALPPRTPSEPEPAKAEDVREKAEFAAAPEKPRLSPDAALILLSVLQREGRFIDFLQQDIAAFSDAEIGAVTRVVHEGCRRALTHHAELVPVRAEREGTSIKIDAGYDVGSIKLTGNVQGSAPYQGVLRHKGWRAQSVKLPELLDGHDANVVAPAEVEL